MQSTKREKNLSEDLQSRLDRCDREIAKIRNMPAVLAGTAPCWLVVLGINDWQYEKRLIEQEISQLGLALRADLV